MLSFSHACLPACPQGSPIEALAAHLGNPAGANFATNGVSLPF